MVQVRGGGEERHLGGAWFVGRAATDLLAPVVLCGREGGWTLICWHQGVTLHVSDLLYGGQRPAHRVALAAGKEHCTNLGNQGRSCLPFALLGPAIPGVPLTKAARLE